MLLFHSVRNVRSHGLEVVLVKLSDFDSEVLVEGPVSSGLSKVTAALKFVFFWLGYVKFNI